MTEHAPAATVETLVYRDRLGLLRVRARWTNPFDGRQMEADEGGVYDNIDAFTVNTIAPLLRRTLRGHPAALG